MARSKFFVSVQTRHPMATRPFVRSFIEGWLALPARLRPEQWAMGEGEARHALSGAGIDAAVEESIAVDLGPMLWRRKAVTFQAECHWRSEIGADPRPYPFGANVRVSAQATAEELKALVRFLVVEMRAAYAMVSTWDDVLAAHLVTWEERVGIAEQMMGLDVSAETIPGLYWMTFVGHELERRMDLGAIGPGVLAVERWSSGTFLQLAPSPAEVTSGQRSALQQSVGGIFFDKDRVDVSALRSDARSVQQAALAIEAAKAKGVNKN